MQVGEHLVSVLLRISYEQMFIGSGEAGAVAKLKPKSGFINTSVLPAGFWHKDV